MLVLATSYWSDASCHNLLPRLCRGRHNWRKAVENLSLSLIHATPRTGCFASATSLLYYSTERGRKPLLGSAVLSHNSGTKSYKPGWRIASIWQNSHDPRKVTTLCKSTGFHLLASSRMATAPAVSQACWRAAGKGQSCWLPVATSEGLQRFAGLPVAQCLDEQGEGSGNTGSSLGRRRDHISTFGGCFWLDAPAACLPAQAGCSPGFPTLLLRFLPLASHLRVTTSAYSRGRHPAATPSQWVPLSESRTIIFLTATICMPFLVGNWLPV